MVFIIGLVLMCVIVWFLDDHIKKYSAYFYIGAFVVTLLSYILYKNVEMSDFIKDYILGIFTTGYLGIAGFYIVMFTGAFKNGSVMIKKLMKIRGELSIISCIFMLAHLVIYGPSYITMAVKNGSTMTTSLLVSIICGTVLLIQMTYLGITSVKAIRRKFKAKTWKNIQRTAYLFYLLMYVHGVTMQYNKVKAGNLNAVITIIVYSMLFFTYVVMRTKKALIAYLKKNNALSLKKVERVFLSVASVIAVIIACIIIVPQFNVYAKAIDKIEAKKKEEEELQAMLEEFNAQVNADTVQVTDSESEEATSDETLKEDVSEQTEATSDATGTITTTTNSSSSSASESTSSSSTSGSPDSSGSNSSSSSSTSSSDSTSTTTRTYKADGVYSGTATVDIYFYDVTVYIKVSNDTITAVYATYPDASDDDYIYSEKAENGLSTSGYSAVTGATYSSDAFKAAYAAALASAKN